MIEIRLRNAWVLVGLLSGFAVAGLVSDTAKLGVAPEEAMSRLTEGNARFVSGETLRPNQTPARRAEVAKKQAPFAVVVTCADSRLTPEFIFDQGIGDLFVVRVAGNTIDSVGMGSIQYACEHLGSRLIVVMGHERCGAVDAAMKGGHLPGSLPEVVEPIMPAVTSAKHSNGDVLDNTIRANVVNMKALLAKDPLIGKMVKSNQVKVIGMRYDLDSGVANPVQ